MTYIRARVKKFVCDFWIDLYIHFTFVHIYIIK